jgi:hypothetical protein
MIAAKNAKQADRICRKGRKERKEIKNNKIGIRNAHGEVRQRVWEHERAC